MSHFTVAVFTEENGKSINELMAPFHEFECTGIVDEYVQSIDQLEEVKEEYNEYTLTKLKSSDGKLFDPYDDRFYREPTPEELKEMGPYPGSGCGNGITWCSKDWNDGRDYRAKILFKPDGYKEVEVFVKDIMTLREFIEYQYEQPIVAADEEPDLNDKHKYGWVRINNNGEVIELIDRTNPNKKWDWWEVGGRWSNMLLNKQGVRVDSAPVGEIDWDNMREDSRIKAEQNWEKAQKEDGPMKYFGYGVRKDDTKESYVQRQTEFGTYSVITPDGVWHSKGEMGWFGFSSETEQEAQEWSDSFYDRFIKDADPALILTIVDCHI